MGEYFAILNLDKEEFVNPSKLGEGVKLFEFGYVTMSALATLLGDQIEPYFDRPSPLIGSWSGDRIVFVGDETDGVEDRLLPLQVKRLAKEIKGPIEHATLVDFALTCCKDISDEVLQAMCGCVYLRESLVDLAEEGNWGNEELLEKLNGWLDEGPS